LDPPGFNITSDDPCASTFSLTRFFQNQDNTSLFSKERPVCPNSAFNRIHVVIPFYNLAEETLGTAIESVRKQDYPRVSVWAYDDGSDRDQAGDILKNVCNVGSGTNVLEFSPLPGNNEDENWQYASDFMAAARTCSSKRSLHCLRSDQHLGPAGGKYWLLRLVQAAVEPNDVVLVLDGDDELDHDPKSLQTVNQAYIDNSAWFTYGSYVGKGAEKVVDLPKEIRSGEKPFEPRDQPWLYGHPRTFKAHLLPHVNRTDFTYSDGSWLVKGTDRGFVYRMLELAGHDRVSYIDTPVYRYKYSSVTSTVATVALKVRKQQIQHLMTLTPSKRLDLPIHIVLLGWKRGYLLSHQLGWLRDQNGLDGRKMHVHIYNNNLEEKHVVEQAAANFTQQGETNGSGPTVTTTVVHSPEGQDLMHNFARFVYVQQLRRSTPMDTVIFLDDGQINHMFLCVYNRYGIM
jgi:glycosyltransferase involved in cell wall biosynthesis